MKAIRSRAYLDGAKGNTCKLRIVCYGFPGDETVVAAHIRDRHTGRSIKASDLSVIDACAACHSRLDGQGGTHIMSREDWLFYALRGLQETLESRVEQGLLTVKGWKP